MHEVEGDELEGVEEFGLPVVESEVAYEVDAESRE